MRQAQPVERSETVLESSSLPAIGTGEALLVYKLGEQRDNRASARRRRPGCSEAESVGREPQRMVRRRSLCQKCRGWHRFSEGSCLPASRFSQSITSGAKTAFYAVFPPHLTHRENLTMPHSYLHTTFQFSSCVTSGAKTASHTHSLPHLTHRE